MAGLVPVLHFGTRRPRSETVPQLPDVDARDERGHDGNRRAGRTSPIPSWPGLSRPSTSGRAVSFGSFPETSRRGCPRRARRAPILQAWTPAPTERRDRTNCDARANFLNVNDTYKIFETNASGSIHSRTAKPEIWRSRRGVAWRYFGPGIGCLALCGVCAACFSHEGHVGGGPGRGRSTPRPAPKSAAWRTRPWGSCYPHRRR